jgi:hypothetical protein
VDQTTDLDAALKFVIGRIEEQASQSGKPLNHEQRLLLSYLPSSISTIVFASDPTFLVPVPRDINYETVRALGKAAYLKDLGQSRVTLEWEFASAVFKLNRHPMWSPLQQAGVRDRRPWWDQFLVVIAALLFIGIAMAIDHGQMGRIRLCIYASRVPNVPRFATNRTVAVGERN